MAARRGLVVRLGSTADSVLVRVPVDRFEIASSGDVVHIGQTGAPLAAAIAVDEDFDAAAVPAGLAIAALSPTELYVFAESREVVARRALRNEPDADRRALLRAAMGHARVLRALAGDVISNPPTAHDFDRATEVGLLTPARLRAAPPLTPVGGSPLARQRAQSADVGLRLQLLSDREPGRLRSRSAFAGITTAAALVLTGCGAESVGGDRRCTDANERIVDDDNCRTYGGGGAGGYYYRYGGRVYDDGTYLRGSTLQPPANGTGILGEKSGSGG